LSESYIITLHTVNTVKSCFYVFVGTKKKCVKSEKHCSYEHFTGTVQKVSRIAENTKCRNVKSRFYCSYQGFKESQFNLRGQEVQEDILDCTTLKMKTLLLVCRQHGIPIQRNVESSATVLLLSQIS